MKTKLICGLLLSGMLVFTGCNSSKVDEHVYQEDANSTTEETTTPSAEAPEGTTAEAIEDANTSTGKIDAEVAKQVDVDKVEAFQLIDIEGNSVEKSFSQEEIATFIEALNTSEISNDAYILMLAGNSLTISLDNEETVTITSYGDEDHIIASYSQGYSFHLVCPEIGKLLLGKSE